MGEFDESGKDNQTIKTVVVAFTQPAIGLDDVLMGLPYDGSRGLETDEFLEE